MPMKTLAAIVVLLAGAIAVAQSNFYGVSNPYNGGAVTGNVTTTGQFANTNNTVNTPSGTTQTINWNNGNYQTLALTSATGTVTLTLTNPIVGASYILVIKEHASSPKAVTWPSSAPDVKWAGGTEPTITATNSAIDVVSLVYDGTNYYGSIVQNLQ